MASIEGIRTEALGQAIDVAVLRKGLDTMEAQGEAAIALIDAAGEVAPQLPRRHAVVTSAK